MGVSSDVNSFLMLMDSCFCKVNTIYKSVVYAYYKNNIICKNAPFEEFYSKICSIFGVMVKPEQIDDLYRFISNPLVDDYVLFIDTPTGDKKTFSISKCKLDDDNTLGIFIDNMEKKKGLLNLIDPLTSVYQKMAFQDYIEMRLKKDFRPYTLMVIDIDDFKGINDTFGHAVGDEILKSVAEILKKNIRNGSVGRFGGDEFICASYASTDFKEVWNLLYKITHEIFDAGSNVQGGIDVSVTIGVSRYGIDGTSFDELFLKADRALYRGKRKGKDCFIIYDDEKHKNINLDGVKRTIFDDRTENYSMAQIISNAYDVLNKNAPYETNIKEICNYIGTILKVDRCILYVDSFDHLERPFASYSAEDDESNIDVDPVSADIWNQHIKNNIVAINMVSNLKNINDVLYKRLSKDNIVSTMRTVISFNGTTIGSIEVDTYTERAWTIIEKNTLLIMSNLLGIYMYKLNENMYLEHKSLTDSLTKTLTYQRFIVEMSKRLNEKNTKMVLYYLNIERFKSINDKFGFKEGDNILRSVAKCLKNTFKNALIARVNGDRFLVFDSDIDSNEIDKKFETFKRDLENIPLSNADILRYIVITCGVYETDGMENNTSAIIDNANIARRTVPANAGTSYALFNKDMETEYKLIHEMEVYLPEALKNEEFRIYLQPKIDLKSGKLKGAEALSRWDYKGNGLIYPNSFIPVFERAGLITKLDLYVFEHICQYLNRLEDMGIEPIIISLNLSRNVTNLDEYIDNLEEIRKKNFIEPKFLEIEITESMFVSSEDKVKDAIKKLHNLGYKIAMDDFGSGYSNLANLADGGFDVIKLDKSLATNNPKSNKGILLGVLAEMASKLNMSVVCEGIETKEERDALISLGFDTAQGYYYSKPITLSEFTEKYFKKGENNGN